MRINIVTGPFLGFPPAPTGAVEKIWLGLAIQFAALGHHVVLAGKAQDSTPHLGGVTLTTVKGYNRSRSIGVDIAKDLIYSLDQLRHLPPADVTVVNSFWLPALAPLATRLGAIVYNVARMPKSQFFLYGKVDRFAAVSRAVAERLRDVAPSFAGRTRVIPNPIRLPHAFTCPEHLNRRNRILYAGRIHPEKGLDLLVDAFSGLSKDFPAAELAFVGPWRQEQGGGGMRYLEQLKAKATPGVTFCEPLFDEARLAELYASAAIFCYPSVAENGESFGVAPLEAMAAAGVPVLSSLECFDDFASDGVNCLRFDHRSPDAVAKLEQALRFVLSDTKRLDAMSRNAVATARMFSFAKVACTYIADFAELAVARR
jgi:glycosyltransferase involved in cell wall biosynthesis